MTLTLTRNHKKKHKSTSISSNLKRNKTNRGRINNNKNQRQIIIKPQRVLNFECVKMLKKSQHEYHNKQANICIYTYMFTSKEEIKNQNIMNTFEMEMELVTQIEGHFKRCLTENSRQKANRSIQRSLQYKYKYRQTHCPSQLSL